MSINQEQLRQITLAILSTQESFSTLCPAAHALVEFFEENSPFQKDMENIGEGNLQLSNGLAISPTQAALCINQNSRTMGFIRGVWNAINAAKDDAGALPVRVLYAGCGPYALQATPLMSVFSPEEVQFSLMDINETSLTSAESLIEKLGYSDFVSEYLLADATEYQMPSGKMPDVIVSETMNVCLEREPQVSVMRNLMRQAPKASMIPQSVNVRLALVNSSKELSIMPADHKGAIPMPVRDRVELGTVFELNQENIHRWNPLETERLPAARICVPNYDQNRYQPMLLTQVTIDDDNVLTCYQSSLNQPQDLKSPDPLCGGEELQFTYLLGSNPGLSWVVFSGKGAEAVQVQGNDVNERENFHKRMDGMVKTKWLKLPFSFDLERLKEDLRRIRPDEWINHMNTLAYRKRWCCVPLYSHDGRSETIYAFDDNANYLPTSILEGCPYFREVIDSLKCKKAGVRLMSLAAGDEIAQHSDLKSAYGTGVLRIHIPIQTSPQVTFTVAGEQVHFTEGDCWYLNADCQHGVQNPTEQDRIHLLIDCRKNEWLEKVFKEAGFVHDEPPKYGDKNITDENVQDIIAVLEEMGTEGGSKRAAELRRIAAA